MANTISNNRISTLVNSQVPFFVRNDHRQFVTFLEKYYEFLEQHEGVVNRTKNIQNYQNIDLTEDIFADKLYSAFLKLIPPNILADKALLLKHIKDFYRAKGTEKSVKFLLNIMFGVIPNEFYYPKKDVLRTSDGKWFVQKSLRVTDVKINGVANNFLSGLEKFNGITVTGLKSGASATVERSEITQETGTDVKELYLSNIDGDFENGEIIQGEFPDIETTSLIKANIFSGILNTITVTNGGSRYNVGDVVIIEAKDIGAMGASAVVSRVSKGNIGSALTVTKGGAGFQQGNFLIAIGDGYGANANVFTVWSDGLTHPNSYNIVADTIEYTANNVLANGSNIYGCKINDSANVSLVLLFNGSNNANVYIDSSDYNSSFSNTGKAMIQDQIVKFGAGALELAGNLISQNFIYSADSSLWELTDKPFTLEGWFNFREKTTNQAMFGQWSGFASSSSWYFWLESNTLFFRVSNGSSFYDLSGPFVPTLGEWYHLACTRDGSGVVRLFVNGQMVAYGTNQSFSYNNPSGTPFLVGATDPSNYYPGWHYNGYIDSIRIVRNECLYSSNDTFTVINYEFDKVSTGNVLFIHTNHETHSYPNLAIQYVTVPEATSNLRANTGLATTITISKPNTSSNVAFGLYSPLNVNNQVVLITSLYSDTTNTNYVTVYPGFIGNNFQKPIGVLSSVTSSNLTVTSEQNDSVIRLTDVIFVRNITNIGVTTQYFDSENTNTVSVTVGTAANSNILLSSGTRLNVNGSNCIITSYYPELNFFYVTPAVPANTTDAVLEVFEPQLESKSIETSNVLFSNDNLIFISGIGYRYITNVVASSAYANVFPNLKSSVSNVSFGLLSNSQISYSDVTVKSTLVNTINLTFAPGYAGAKAGWSNVFFTLGDKLNVNNRICTVTTLDHNTGEITVDPGFIGGIDNAAIIVIRSPFNSTSNLTISTGGSSTNNVVFSRVISQSNVFFETGDSLNVSGQFIIVQASNTTNAHITANANLPAGLISVPFQVIKRPNVNTTIANAMSYWVYSNTGPIKSTIVISSGQNYSEAPIFDVLSNTTIASMGILGSLNIANPGLGYSVGDIIEFVNSPGNFGCGANAVVRTVNALGAITNVAFTELTGHMIGGRGYAQSALPTTNVRSSTKTVDAEILVTAILGDGEDGGLISTRSSVGSVEEIKILTRGYGYLTPPTINLTQTGDGTATANATIISGLFSYPGYYLNDDGQVSSYNFLQDRDYYQNFSYVIRSSVATDLYRDAVFDLTHPMGMKLFGEYDFVDHLEYRTSDTKLDDSINSFICLENYTKVQNTINIFYEDHNLVQNDIVALEFTSGSVTNVNILEAGSRYANNGSLTVTSNSGTGLTATYTTDEFGRIVTANITNRGVGYNYSSNIQIFAPTSNATSNLRMNSFVLSSQTYISNSNYSISTSQFVSFLPPATSNTFYVTDAGSYFSPGERIKFGGNSRVYTIDSILSSRITVLEVLPKLVENSISKIYDVNVFSNTVTMNLNNVGFYTLAPSRSNIYFTTNDTLRLHTPSNGSFDVVVTDFSTSYSNTSNLSANININAITSTSSLKLNTSVRVLNTSNLLISTGSGSILNVATLSARAGNSNVAITINDVLEVEGVNVTVTHVQPISNTVKLFPGLPGNLTSSVVKVYQFVTKTNGLTGTSNVSIQLNDTISVISYVPGVSQLTTSNLTIKTPSGANSNTGNLFMLNTSNLLFITGYGFETNVANTFSLNTSNITINTATPSYLGAFVSRANLSAIAERSNVALANGTLLLVNGRITTITSVVPSSESITFSPSLDASLVLSRLQVYQPALAVSSNVRLANGVAIQIDGYAYNLTSVPSNSNTINFSPKISSNLQRRDVKVYVPAFSQNSNVAIANGTYLYIDDNKVVITSAVLNSNAISFYPTVNGNLMQTSVSVYSNVESQGKVTAVNPSSDVIITDPKLPANLTLTNFSVIKSYANVGLVEKILTLNTSNLKVNTLTSSQYSYSKIELLGLSGVDYIPFRAGNSNVSFASGYTLNINNRSVVVTSYNANSSIITVKPSLQPNLVLMPVKIYEISYVDKNLQTSNVFFGTNYGLIVNNESLIITNSSQTSSTLNVSPRPNNSYVGKTIQVIKYANLVNVVAVTNTKTGMPQYNLNNSLISTVNSFSVLWTGPARFNTSFKTDNELKIVKDGLYKVISVANANTFSVILEPIIDSLSINSSGLKYNSNGIITFTGGYGSNANAEYTINSLGSIVDVWLDDRGYGYNAAPTATANGGWANSVNATFTVNMAYLANATGLVLVTKKTT